MTDDISANNLLNQAPCGFIIMNSDGVVLHLNETMKEWLGYEAEETIANALHFYDLLTIGSKIYCETHFFPMLQMHGHVKEINLEMKRRDDVKIPVLVNTISQLNEKNEREYHSIVIEITHRKSYEKELLKAKKDYETLVGELSNINRQLSQFAHTVAHDLKSPLNNIIGLVSLVKDDSDSSISPDSMEFITAALERGDYMTQFINGLLDFASSGEKQFQYETLQVNTIFSRVRSVLEKQLSDVKANLKMPETEVYIHGNKVEITRLFQNLIENAIKYRRTDVDLEIGITCEPSEEIVTIKIKDNGLGIPSEHLTKIFNPFTRAHVGSSSAKGSGIGLATCKKIVDAHNGDIWVDSVLNEGTTFYMRFPKPVANP